MTGPAVTILQREPAEYVSTFFNEIVTCRLPDGHVRRFLSKRGGVHEDPTYGHRDGVPYEAEVYRSVLEPLGGSTPRFFSAQCDSATGETTLLIDYIENATRLQHADPAATLAAARWIGAFHRVNDPRADALVSVINRYDSAYYSGWMRRTLEYSLDAQRSWLTTIGHRFPELADDLLTGSLTIIHGEYYPQNILVRDGVIYPVDWESAAIAAGEIDLASLTEGWSDEDKRAFEVEYCRARWPSGRPTGFERRLSIATMYLLFRWLGDRPDWATGEGSERRFESLRQLGEQLGVL